MESCSDKKFCSRAVSWVLAGLWVAALFAPVLFLDYALAAVGCQVGLTVAMTGLNIYFRKEKRLVFWLINAFQLVVTALYLLFALSLWQIVTGGRAARRDAKQLGFSSASINKLSEYDSHDDFLGDGIGMRVYGLKKEEGLAVIKNAEGWREFPLDKNAYRLVYGNVEQPPYLRDSEGRTLAPYLTNGYWFFEDRQVKQEQPEYSTDVLSRHSLNFTLALYNPVTERLYVLDMDT